MLHCLLNSLFRKIHLEPRCPQGHESATLDMKLASQSPPRRPALVSSSSLPALIIPQQWVWVNSQHPAQAFLPGKSLSPNSPHVVWLFLFSTFHSEHPHLSLCSTLQSHLKLFVPPALPPTSILSWHLHITLLAQQSKKRVNQTLEEVAKYFFIAIAFCFSPKPPSMPPFLKQYPAGRVGNGFIKGH